MASHSLSVIWTGVLFAPTDARADVNACWLAFFISALDISGLAFFFASTTELAIA